MYVNDETVNLETPVYLIDNRTLVPLRAVSEAFGVMVDWDEAAGVVRVRKPPFLVRMVLAANMNMMTIVTF